MSTELPLGGSRPVPKGWNLYSVDEIKAKEKHACVAGPFGSSISSKYFTEDGVPIIRGSNLKDDLTRFVSQDFAFVSEQQAKNYPAQHVKAGDLVFTCWGTIGQVGVIPKDGPYPEYIISNKQLKLRVNPDLADNLFVYYYLASREGVEHIRSRAIGSAVPSINLGILKSLKLALPPLPTQREIVDILSKYDRLIDNNTRRIALLEESIHRLYKEWFVYLRFPEWEKVAIVEGVPEGWSKQTLDDISLEIRQGIHPSQTEPNTPYVGLEHIPRQSIALTDWGFSCDVDSNKFKFAYRDILFGKIRPYFHKVVIAPVTGICSSDTIVIRPQTEEFLGLLLSLTSSVHFVDFASKTSKEGSKMPRADWKFMKQYPVLVPPQPMLNDFNNFVINAVSQIENLIFINQKLREARDLLLPRLMNGSIAV